MLESTNEEECNFSKPFNSSIKGSFKEDIVLFLRQTLSKALETLQHFNDYQIYCTKEKLYLSERSIIFIYNQLVSTISFLKDLRDVLEFNKFSLKSLIEAEIGLRTAMQSISSINLYLSWRAPAYTQSMIPQFYNLIDQGSKKVLYERYGHNEADRIETQLLKIFNISSDRFACIAVNSGMAAYSLVEAFLIRYLLKPGDCIVTSPYIYFELNDQLKTLHWLNIIKSDEYDLKKLIDIIENNTPKIVFVDPITNTAEQRMIDIQCLLEYFHNHSSCPLFVIDGSMMTCAATIYFDAFPRKEKIIYIESCSKYLQFGLDMSLAGVVICDVKFKSIFNTLRQNMGLILTEQNAHLFPVYKKEQFLNKVHRIEQNACNIAHNLYIKSEIIDICEVIHPSLINHPDYKLASKISRYGGCITFTLRKQGVTEKLLKDLVSIVINNARVSKIPIVHGESFGYSFPRITTVSIEKRPYFIRLYVGDQGKLNKVIVQLIVQSFKQIKVRLDTIPNEVINSKVKMPLKKKYNKSINDILTSEQIGNIISAARNFGRHGNRDATMISILYRCSLPIAELLNLRWVQIDLKTGLLRMNRTKNVDYLYPIFGSELRSLRKIRLEYPDSQFVFLTKSHKPMATSTFRKIVERASKKAGLDILVNSKMLSLQRQKYLQVGEDYYF